jgi:L-amino acid N-acyltransferase YncA
MELIEREGAFPFAEILELIKAEWPSQWKAATDAQMLAEMEGSSDARFDVNKLLLDGERIVGWYRYSRWPREESNLEDAHTLDIAISPGLQGRGYGSMLMSDMLGDCRGRGYRKLMSRTFLDNAASIALHRKSGFSEAFRTEDSIVWERRL